MVSDPTFVVNNIKLKASTETFNIYAIATRKGYVFDVPVLLQYFSKGVTKKDVTEDISSSYEINPKSTFLRTSSMDSIGGSAINVNTK